MSISSIGTNIIDKEAGSALSQLSDDYDTFVTLLVAQIKHQDPLEPMDSTEFVSQTAQLTQVEQSVRMNEQLEGVRSQLSISGAMSETSLIGKSVTVATDKVSMSDGKLAFSYELDANATGVQAIITDSSGNVVKTVSDLSGEAGKLHDLSWDGISDSGKVVPEGVFTVTLASATTTGSYTIFRSDVVKAVEYVSGKSELRLSDGSKVPVGDVVRAT